ncbi:MAG: SDR family oxidoreductase [Candidatus Rokubacteria bacterium]|nr:SDR family oxidoreductase [Candidatus Rokubacteria bacterium]MBI3107943.1 SDR family oxidoreductase [Candidatus Rokubacteria bacterium]
MTGLFTLDGQSCLVTGGGRGIGREAALAFAAAGATVAVGDIDADLATDTVRAIDAAGGRGRALVLDVGVPASVDAAVAEAARAGDGRLDVLLNNAGITVVKPTDAVTLEEWERVIRVDLTGVFLCAQAAARVMRRHGGGRIINMASIYGLVGPVLHAASPYAAAKGGVIGLTRALAVEWAAAGIRVNAVAPTHVRTEMTRARVDDAAYRAAMLARTPLGRVLEPRDVVGALLFLASPAADGVTGHVLAVDGGWLAA